MEFKSKFKLLAVLVIFIAAILYFFPDSHHFVASYNRYFFRPYQSLRNILFGWIPFSLGDILYVVAGGYLLFVVGRWFYYLIKFSLKKELLAMSLLNTVNTIVFCYLLFLLGWGGNYYRPSLNEYWHLEADSTAQADSSAAIAFDKFLITKLNATAPHYHPLSFDEATVRAKAYYRIYTDCKTKKYGIGVKSSLYGFLMERMAVEGYYNPFTGEAQVNKNLPSYILPFVVCHEIAHQGGVAAEGDANLLAYTLSTMVDDTSFSYSGYLNIWLYTHGRVYRRDSATANKLEKDLNPLTVAHIDTLEQIRKKYQGNMSRYSSEMYDSYLRMHSQAGGIKSYANVVWGAWQIEQRRKQKYNRKFINVP